MVTPPDMSQVGRLLIVKLSSIGDVVHALPVSAALGEAFPHVEISWVVEPLSAPIVQGNPFIKEVIVLPADWKKSPLSFRSRQGFQSLRRDLRSRQFDVTLDLQGLTKSALVARATGARWRFGYDWLRELAPRLESRVPRRPESIHVVDQFLDVARFLGAPVGSVRFPLVVPPEDDASAAGLLEGAGIQPDGPFIALNPSTGRGGNKGWGGQQFAKAIDALAQDPGLPIVLIGSRSDLAVVDEIAQTSSASAASLVGKTTLKQLAAVLQRSRLHLCGDTGSAHMAAALGTRVVSLFGRSNPARLAPYGQQEWAIHHRDQCASKCLRFHESAQVNSKQKCLSPPPVCLASITVTEVVETVRRALA